MSSSGDSESVEIPRELYSKLSQKSGTKEPIAVRKFILDLLEKAVSTPDTHQFSSEEEQEIKQRLKSLGYM